MRDDTPFADFIRRIRAGDAQAAAELVQRYESVIRVEVRHRLSAYAVSSIRWTSASRFWRVFSCGPPQANTSWRSRPSS
jgi:hypothetical protein